MLLPNHYMYKRYLSDVDHDVVMSFHFHDVHRHFHIQAIGLSCVSVFSQRAHLLQSWHLDSGIWTSYLLYIFPPVPLSYTFICHGIVSSDLQSLFFSSFSSSSILSFLISLIPNSFPPVWGCHSFTHRARIYCDTWRKQRFAASIQNEIVLSFVWIEGTDSISTLFWFLAFFSILLNN